jgi:hypothetical protein
MSKARYNRDRKPGRRPPFRDPKPTILIVCEGEKTEPQYFHGFQSACHNPRVTIKVADEHGVPKTLVELAKELKNNAESNAIRERDENLAFDSVWCVFDIDEHPHVPDAKQMARDNGIDLAISNPCVELWLLLHFRDYPGMQDRNKIKMLLKSHVFDYDKHVEFARYATGYLQAVIRAKRMDQSAEVDGESGRNPTTGVYKLTELIRGDSALG